MVLHWINHFFLMFLTKKRQTHFMKSHHSFHMSFHEVKFPQSIILLTYYYWLVVYLPLWKLWVRQLGWWNSQNDGKVIKIDVSNHQSDSYILLTYYDSSKSHQSHFPIPIPSPIPRLPTVRDGIFGIDLKGLDQTTTEAQQQRQRRCCAHLGKGRSAEDVWDSSWLL